MLTAGLLLVQEVGWHDRPENSSGAVAGRLSSDTLSIRGAVGDQLGIIIQNLACLIAAYTIAFTAGWRMTLVITAAAPLICVGAWIEGKATLTVTEEVCPSVFHCRHAHQTCVQDVAAPFWVDCKLVPKASEVLSAVAMSLLAFCLCSTCCTAMGIMLNQCWLYYKSSIENGLNHPQSEE
jgi:ABC-type multidrug transport system fused ATPase/permease subunit